MYKKSNIRTVFEDNEYVYLNEESELIRLPKKDLGGIVPKRGDCCEIVRYPGYKPIVAAFILDGKKVFHKSQDEVIEEYYRHLVGVMEFSLPLLARLRLEMFSMYDEKFGATESLWEVAALFRGYAIFTRMRTFEAIKAFAEYPYEEQNKLVPCLEQSCVPNIPSDVLVNYAKAYYLDEINGITEEKALQSAIMNMEDVWACMGRCKSICEPRKDFINAYMHS